MNLYSYNSIYNYIIKIMSNFINKFFVKEPVVLLGRWNIVYYQQKINKKIDLANEDHCGTCNNNNKDNKDNIIIDNKKFKLYDARSVIFYEAM